MSNIKRLAVLIDGENAQPSTLPAIMKEVNRYGVATIRRIYGDWTTPQMSSWKEILHTYAIQPIQQFHYTTGKNATDSTLIIDAMDILHTVPIEGFFLVSSDSDYTRLATRIRENGLLVVGVGKKSTPKAFINACEVFIQVEKLISATASKPSIPLQKENLLLTTEGNSVNSFRIEVSTTTEHEQVNPFKRLEVPPTLEPELTNAPQKAAVSPTPEPKLPNPLQTATVTPATEPEPSNPPKKVTPTTKSTPSNAPQKKAVIPTVPTPPNPPKKLVKLCIEAFQQAAQEDGWVTSHNFGISLKKIHPSFTLKMYGFKRLAQMVVAMPTIFDVRRTKANGATTVHIRMKTSS